MKTAKKGLGIVAAAFAVAASVAAQAPDEVLREVEKLKAQLADQSRVIESQTRRIDELERGKSDEVRQSEVEKEINRISDRAAAATTVRSAAERLTFSGEYRFRGYLEFGDDATGTERDGYFNSSKIRIGILYEFSKNVAAYADIQSTFAFGHNGHSSSNLTNADPGEPLHVCQAWLEVGDVFDREEFRVRVGRQSVTLGNQFQFGNADWYNGYFFDGVRADWSDESWSLTGLFLRTATVGGNDGNQFIGFGPANIAGTPARDGHDHDEYYSLYFTLKSIKNHTLDLYWIYANWTEGVTLNSLGGTPAGVSGAASGFSPAYFHTLGARMGGVVDVAEGLDWNLELAYQTGDLDAAPVDLDVDAFAIEGEIGLTFEKEHKIRAWLRGLFAEGPETGETGYLPLAPNRHSQTASFRARYGQMDVIPMTNVFALTGGAHFDPAADWTVGLTGTWGQTDTDGGIFDEAYGFEVDLWAEYRYSDQLTFSGGASVLFPDDQLDGTAAAASTTFDGDAQFLLWLQARLFF